MGHSGVRRARRLGTGRVVAAVVERLAEMASKIGDSSMSLSRLRRDGPSGGVRFGRHRGARPPAGRSGAQARAAGGWVRMAALTWGYVTSTLSRAKQNRRLGSTRAFPAATVAMNSCNLGGVPHILVS